MPMERDTMTRLREFIVAYNKEFIGGQMDLKKTILFEEQVSHIKLSLSDPLNHTTDIILLNPEVRIQAYFPYPHHFDAMAHDYLTIVHNSK